MRVRFIIYVLGNLSENFNYDDDIKSMDEMTDIEDLIEDSE
jgi:hypothetical protein